MSAPRRPRAGGSSARRRAGSGRAAARSTTAPRRPLRPARPAPSPSAAGRLPRTGRGGSPLTTRAAILGLVVCTLVFSAVLPLRTFLAQRADIASLEQEQAATRERVATLEREKQQLEDPAFVATEARRRLHMARPGEVSYVLIPPTAPPAGEDTAPAPDGGPDAPWWSQVWASVAAADRGDDAGPAGSDAVPAPPAP